MRRGSRSIFQRLLDSCAPLPRPNEAKLRSLFPVYDSTVPYIVNVTAEDPDHGDRVYSAGDVIKVHFNMQTDLGAVVGNKAFVDRLLRYECCPPQKLVL